MVFHRQRVCVCCRHLVSITCVTEQFPFMSPAKVHELITLHFNVCVPCLYCLRSCSDPFNSSTEAEEESVPNPFLTLPVVDPVHPSAFSVDTGSLSSWTPNSEVMGGDEAYHYIFVSPFFSFCVPTQDFSNVVASSCVAYDVAQHFTTVMKRNSGNA